LIESRHCRGWPCEQGAQANLLDRAAPYLTHHTSWDHQWYAGSQGFAAQSAHTRISALKRDQRAGI
jgi:hypothetical protein